MRPCHYIRACNGRPHAIGAKFIMRIFRHTFDSIEPACRFDADRADIAAASRNAGPFHVLDRLPAAPRRLRPLAAPAKKWVDGGQPGLQHFVALHRHLHLAGTRSADKTSINRH